MRLKFLTILVYLIPYTAFSQIKLSGKVVDKDKQPVSFANIQLFTPESAFFKGDMTKEDGTFNMNVKRGKYIFNISQFGKLLYSKTLQLGSNVSMSYSS